MHPKKKFPRMPSKIASIAKSRPKGFWNVSGGRYDSEAVAAQVDSYEVDNTGFRRMYGHSQTLLRLPGLYGGEAKRGSVSKNGPLRIHS
mgnify:CR=1 FL=1